MKFDSVRGSILKKGSRIGYLVGCQSKLICNATVHILVTAAESGMF